MLAWDRSTADHWDSLTASPVRLALAAGIVAILLFTYCVGHGLVTATPLEVAAAPPTFCPDDDDDDGNTTFLARTARESPALAQTIQSGVNKTRHIVVPSC